MNDKNNTTGDGNADGNADVDGKAVKSDSKKTEILRAVKFTLFSISAGLVQILSFTALTELTPMSYWPRYLISLVLSVVWNFTFNRRYTFRSTCNVPRAMLLVGLYYLVFTPLSTVGGEYLTNAGWNDYLVTALNMVVNFITEYLFDTFVVFRGSIDTKK